VISEQRPGEFSLRVNRTTRSHGDDQYRITIDEDQSGLRVLTLNLTARQFAEVLTGMSLTGVDGELIARQYRDRLGRRVEHHTVSFSRFLSPEQQESLAQWMELSRGRVGADSASVYKHNSHTSVTFRWYRDPTSEPLTEDAIEAALAPRPDDLTARS
jgi:hypothetical protein